MIRCTIAEFKKFLKIVPTDKPILLIGDTGIGKTTICRRAAEEAGVHYAYVPCMSISDTVLLSGIPDVSGTVYKPMEWYEPGVVTLLLIDEINRSEAIINSLMELATDQHIGSVKLAPGSRVIAAMNPSTENYQMVKELELSHMSRFFVIELAPTVDEWLDVAEEEKIHPVILKYIRMHREAALDPNPDGAKRRERRFYTNLDATRRGWYTMSATIYNGEKANEFDPNSEEGRRMLALTVAGYVGPEFSDSFSEMYYATKYSLSAEDMSRRSDPDITPYMLMEAGDDRWKSELPNKVADLCRNRPLEAARLVTSVAQYIASKLTVLVNTTTNRISKIGIRYAINFYKFVHSCTPEMAAQMYFSHVKPLMANRKDDSEVLWVDVMVAGCPELRKLFEEIRKPPKKCSHTNQQEDNNHEKSI